MRYPDCVQLVAGSLDLSDDAISIGSRINHRGRSGRGIGHDIAVLWERTDDKAVDVQAEYPPVPTISGTAAPLRIDVRYFSTAIAAVVASPAAVVTCRVSCARTSPAAKRPGIEVSMFASVTR